MSTITIPTACTVKSGIRSQGPSVLIKSTYSLRSFKSISKASSLKISNHFRASAMVVYKVKLIGPEGQEHEFDAPDDTYILDTAEAAGVELPYSCRAEAGHAHALAKWSLVKSISQMDPSLMNHK